jgi:PAS domain S-box-containing protein
MTDSYEKLFSPQAQAEIAALQEQVASYEQLITEKNAYIDQLSNQEARFRTLVEHSTDAFIVISKEGIMLFVNPAAETLFGFSAHNLVGEVVGVPLAQNKTEIGVLHKYIPSYLAEMQVVEIVWDGEPAYLTTFQDITIHKRLEQELERRVEERTRQLNIELEERKRMEQALRESEERFRTIIEKTPVAVCLTNEAGMFEYVNPAYCRLYHYTEEELLGKSFTIVTNEEDRDYLAKLHQNVIDGQSEMRGEWNVVAKDGTTLTILADAVQIIGSDGNPKKATFIMDITELKRIQRELQQAWSAAETATRTKSAFLANMSHEIRTPMNAVIGMTNLLLDTSLTSEQMEFVNTIRLSGEALLTLINDILDLSKIEVGKLELEYHPFHLRTCIEEALDLLAPEAAEKGLNLAYVMGEEIPSEVIGDNTRLRQILVNLLSNAVKFTHEGEVVVTIERMEQPGESLGHLLPDQQPAMLIKIAVKDTGIGIPHNHLNRLFQNFSQGNASMARKHGGSGLGLAISKLLAEMMGGSIWVESVVDQGSTFYVTVTLGLLVEGEQQGDGQQQSRHTSGREEIDTTLFTGRRVLIVEENDTNRYILNRLATSWGMLPTAVSTGEEALALVRQREPFDVVIFDTQLPGMQGTVLAEKLLDLFSRSIYPTSLPLIAWTSILQWGEMSKSDLATIVTFLVKPIRFSTLYNALHGIFHQEFCSLPQSSAHAHAPSKPASTAYAQMAKQHPLHILLAEDNAVNQKVTLRLLEKLSYRADVVSNGIEVLQALRRQSYDVVLMDIQMPDMDGIEATHRIRTQWEPGQQPYIIALTAHALEGHREWLLQEGMDNYVSKPVRLQHLATALEQAQHRQEEHKQVLVTPPDTAPSPVISTPDEAPVNQTVLDEFLSMIAGNDPDTARDFIGLYLEDARKLLLEMLQTYREGMMDDFIRNAHSLKSSSAQLGANRLSGICRTIETQSRRGLLKDSDIEHLIQQAEEEHKRVRTVLIATMKRIG